MGEAGTGRLAAFGGSAWPVPVRDRPGRDDPGAASAVHRGITGYRF